MSKFYTDVYVRGDKVFLRGYDMGFRVTKKIDYKPYMFINRKDNKNSPYRTLDGTPVSKIDFDSIRDARDFIERYKDVSNMEIFGLNKFQYMYIYDNYKGDIDYDPKKVNIVTMDIECAADEGFPNIQRADKEITAITLRNRGKSFVFGCGHFVTNDQKINYIKCDDEHDLLRNFLDTWESLDIDVVTGWNIEFFDIPYIINRIKFLFNELEAKRLSPWKHIYEKNVEFRGKMNQTYDVKGIAVLDYYQVYRKFSFGNQESYKLDYIAQVELGEKKIDYSEYGNLLELYKNNYQKFIEYNIHDCILVERLDDKLKFLEQIMALAYDAKVNYNDTMTTVLPWDIIIHNYLLNQNIVIPQFQKNNSFLDSTSLVGGYVKEPKVGLSKWVVSFDLTSSYPNQIIQYNISPETFHHREENWGSIDQILTRKTQQVWWPLENSNNELTIAANGCLYRKDKKGFLPTLMEKMLNDRSKYKRKMLDCKKELEILETEMRKRGILSK